MTGSGKSGNESSDSTKDEKFLDWLRDSWFPKKDSPLVDLNVAGKLVP
jgi:hypothetical protein